MATAEKKPRGLISTDDIEGTSVFDQSGNEIGTIDHLMIERMSGLAHYAVISFSGFAGLIGKKYPLKWDSLGFSEERGGYVADVTKEQLERMPEVEGQRVPRAAKPAGEFTSHGLSLGSSETK